MQIILEIITADWDLFVWAKSPEKKQIQLAKTLANRHKTLPLSDVMFSHPLEIESIATSTPFWRRIGTKTCAGFTMPTPIFFENTHYEFEFVFKADLDENPVPKIEHKLNRINDLFRLSTRKETTLNGGVHFRNDIGWFKLPLTYFVGGVKKQVAISFEVLPTKMDLESDLNAIYRVLDVQYPLWRFALAESTEQSVDRTHQRHEPFELLWIAEFESLRLMIEKGFKQILNAPHSRLLPEQKNLKAERLKGKLPHKTLEKVKQDLASGLTHKRYAVTQKKLSVNTPENQFIKYVLQQLSKRLNKFYKTTLDFNNQPENQKLSLAFFEEIKAWILPLERFQNHNLFKEIGDFNGLNGESLVLQQKTGYATVYRAWQQLKLYLGVLGNQASVSMKTIEELYEIWCFLEVKRILIEELKFVEQKSKKILLRTNGLELDVNNGNYGAFKLTRPDGISIELKHEPLFRNSPIENGIRVWTASQKPDILLEVTFESGNQFIWLFDAKYRIKADKQVTLDQQKIDIDWVPDDALNQMHRYRDALIYEGKASGLETKSRPVFGAYALYPGYFDQACQDVNPYQEAIQQIDIGAFPLLPSQSGLNGSTWLTQFLQDKIGTFDPLTYSTAVSDYLYLEDSARIPYRGLSVSNKRALTFVMPSAPKKGRTKVYVDGFLNGQAKWYHVPVKTIASDYEKTIMYELEYLAVASILKGSHARQIEYVWPIRTVTLKKRFEINEEQSGVNKKGDEVYWLLELDRPIKLNRAIANVPSRSFKDAIKLTTLNALNEADTFQEITETYAEVALV